MMMLAIPFGSPLNGGSALARIDQARPGEPTASTSGAVRLLVLHFLVMACAVAAMWWLAPPLDSLTLENAEIARNLGFGAGIIALVSAIVGRYRPALSPFMAPVFALSGGMFIGGLSLAAEIRFPGIALQTTLIAAAVFIVMLCLYLSRLVRLSERFKMILATAISGVALIYLFSFLSLIVGYKIPFIHGAGIGAALWFAVTAGLAALNLLVDFQRIEALDAGGKVKTAEWHAVLALMTTFVWMFVSLLRLMRNLRR